MKTTTLTRDGNLQHLKSSILYKSSDGAVIVLDIPRSLEEAQVLPGQAITRRIISTHPIEAPWQAPEPNKDAAKYVSPSAAVAELMTQERVRAALRITRAEYNGPWCLPRVTRQQTNTSLGADEHVTPPRKRKAGYKSSSPATAENQGARPANFLIPEQSYHLLGTIESRREAFLQSAPQFDLIVLDPPWPNRSVKRKSKSYTTAYSVEEAGELLSGISLASHLKPDGLAGIWVTNKAAVADLLTAPGGIFDRWGVELVGEWVWLKVTSAGEPILDTESTWRKPWERLLIVRKAGSPILPAPRVKVILGVPDLHSRKPNLRGLFQDILPRDYIGLEVFSRILTAGWWGWGNEALKFQQHHHWTAEENEKVS